MVELKKFVSWRCVTYQREEWLPKVVDMFLQQDYSNKEFVILNDDPDVEYICKYPEIRIYNWAYRFRNLREKANYATRLCNGDIFIPIADDDKYESHMTSCYVDEIDDDPFVACNGFWKRGSSGTEWAGMGIAALYACRTDFFKRMGGYAMWLPKPRKWEDGWDWVVHPDNFIERVQEAGCYKEFKVGKRNAFFTWVRGADHSIWCTTDSEKYIIKKRNPKIIRI